MPKQSIVTSEQYFTTFLHVSKQKANSDFIEKSWSNIYRQFQFCDSKSIQPLNPNANLATGITKLVIFSS